MSLSEADKVCDPRGHVDFGVDEDIAGWGVIVSFIASSVLCLIASTIYYICFWGRTHDLPSSAMTIVESLEPPNPVDECVFRFRDRVGKLFNGFSPREPNARLDEAFRTCILALSDLQLLTGTCALAAGFMSIEQIPNIYWQVLVNVAWLSHLTHQCVLALLRKHLQQQRSHWGRAIRVALMTMLFLLLFIALMPTIYFDWRFISAQSVDPTYQSSLDGVPPALPMRCFYNKATVSYIHRELYPEAWSMDTGPFFNGVFAMVFLVITYTTRLVKLFNTSSDFFRGVRAGVGNMCQRLMCFFVDKLNTVTFGRIRSRYWFFLIECPLVATYSNCRVAVDLYASTLSDLIGLYFACIFAVHRLFLIKQTEAKLIHEEGIPEDEGHKLGFGQLLPLTLLVTPFIAIGKSMWKYQAGRQESTQIDTRRTPIEPGYLTRRHSSFPLSVEPFSDQPSIFTVTSKIRGLPPKTRLGHLLDRQVTWNNPWMVFSVISIATSVILFLAQLYQQLITPDIWSPMSSSALILLFTSPLLLAMVLPSFFCTASSGWWDSGGRWFSRAYTFAVIFAMAWGVIVQRLSDGSFFGLRSFFPASGVFVTQGIVYCLCVVVTVVACIWPGPGFKDLESPNPDEESRMGGMSSEEDVTTIEVTNETK